MLGLETNPDTPSAREKFYDQIEGFILPFQIKYLMKLSVLFQVNIYPWFLPRASDTISISNWPINSCDDPRQASVTGTVASLSGEESSSLGLTAIESLMAATEGHVAFSRLITRESTQGKHPY